MRGASEVPAGERVGDPEARLQHAREVAWRSLNRRDRTEVELRETLAGRRVEPTVIKQVLGELAEGGYVDDARYAQRFAEDRRRLEAWGSERIERRLLALGVAREHIASALAEQDSGAELDAAVALLERRWPAVPETPRDRDRALATLVRKGYDSDLAHDALRRHAGASQEG